MNILFVTDPTSLGGATNALVMLTKQLKSKGCTIIVCVSRTPELIERLKKNGIRAVETGHIPAMVNCPRNRGKALVKKIVFSLRRIVYNLSAAIKRVEREVDLSSIDLIYTNSARSDLGCLLARKYGIRHIVHLREFGVEDFGCMFLRRNYYSFLRKNADCFVAISDAVKESWISKGIPREKIVRIYDGIEISSIHPRVVKKVNCQELRMVIVGGIMPAKGQHLCIKALRALPKDIREKVSLDLIGWEYPYYRKYLNQLIEKYKLSEQVRFCGIKDGVGDVLCEYDVGLMASQSEGFGLVTAEYMAAGLCVVANNAGANPELISQNVDGLLFEQGDYKSLAQCISRLYHNREELERLALNGQRKAQKEFDIIGCANNVYRLCSEIVS